MKMSTTFGKSVVFSGTPVSSTNKTDRHDIIEILLKVALNNITLALTKTLFIKLYVRVASYMENIDMTASYYKEGRFGPIQLV